MKSLFFLILSSLILFHPATAQHNKLAAAEQQLVDMYARMKEQSHVNVDSVNYYAQQFEARLSKLVQDDPATLSYPFTRLKAQGVYIITSGDAAVRIYSWDTWTGGTARIFGTIHQWKINNKVYTRIPRYEETDLGSFCSAIYTAHTGQGPVYLAITNSIFSTRDVMQSVTAYTIKEHRLATAERFKTKTQSLSRIAVEFDFFSVADRPERPLQLITYDPKYKILYIPLVNERQEVTRKNLLYRMQGSDFRYLGIETVKRK